MSRQVEPPQHPAAFTASLAQLHQPTNSSNSPTQARKHSTGSPLGALFDIRQFEGCANCQDWVLTPSHCRGHWISPAAEMEVTSCAECKCGRLPRFSGFTLGCWVSVLCCKAHSAGSCSPSTQLPSCCSAGRMPRLPELQLQDDITCSSC